MSKFTRKAAIGGLVLTCRAGQKIVINYGELLIEVVEVQGKQVRIAFKAAKEISIKRGDENHEGTQIKPEGR